jgi:hypothetical protein
MTMLQVLHQRSGRHHDHGRFTATSRAAAALTVLAAFRCPMPVADEIPKRTKIPVRLKNDVAAITAITTIGAAARNVDLAPKTAAAVPTISGTAVQNDAINKHRTSA